MLKITERGFEPLSSQLGISGTSYRLQLGTINDKWAARVLKGQDVLDSYVFKDEDVAESGIPNQNLIVGYVLRTLTLPNINPYGVMRTVQALVKQAQEKKEQKKVVATVSDAKDIELEKVPESELKRPTAKGWVKEDGSLTREEQEEATRKAFKEKMVAKKATEVVTGPEPAEGKEKSAATIKTTRKLPSIPSADSPVDHVKVEPESESLAKVEAQSEEIDMGVSLFCPSCGKDINWKFCPFCGEPLPHKH